MSKKVPQKYKIQIGTPKVPDELIDRHKNFSGLLHQHKEVTKHLYRKPLYKNPKTFLFIFMMAVIFYLVYLAFQEDKELEQQPKESQEIQNNEQSSKGNSFILPFS